MKRMIYRGQVKEGFEEAAQKIMKRRKNAHCMVREGYIMTISAFYWNRNIFLYYECVQNVIEPHDIFHDVEAYMEDWPGDAKKRKWIPMIDVFHFNVPADCEHWLRKKPVERREGRVAQLKPEKISSYIYYHYQVQGEKTFLGGKYDMIAMHENLLFGYQEYPTIIEKPVNQKKLINDDRRLDWINFRVDLHFQPWEDGHLYFKQIEQLFSYYMDCI